MYYQELEQSAQHAAKENNLKKMDPYNKSTKWEIQFNQRKRKNMKPRKINLDMDDYQLFNW